MEGKRDERHTDRRATDTEAAANQSMELRVCNPGGPLLSSPFATDITLHRSFGITA